MALPNNNPLTQDRQWQWGMRQWQTQTGASSTLTSPVTFIHPHKTKTRTRAAVTHASWSRTWPYGICSEERGRKAGTDLTQDYTFNLITLGSNLSRWRDLRHFQFLFTAICVHMSLVLAFYSLLLLNVVIILPSVTEGLCFSPPCLSRWVTYAWQTTPWVTVRGTYGPKSSTLRGARSVVLRGFVGFKNSK